MWENESAACLAKRKTSWLHKCRGVDRRLEPHISRGCLESSYSRGSHRGQKHLLGTRAICSGSGGSVFSFGLADGFGVYCEMKLSAYDNDMVCCVEVALAKDFEAHVRIHMGGTSAKYKENSAVSLLLVFTAFVFRGNAFHFIGFISMARLLPFSINCLQFSSFWSSFH